jgi:6-phosphogluconolactonase
MFVGAGKGVSAYRFDSAAGKAEPLGLVGESSGVSALAAHPTQDFLYAAASGSVIAFKIDRATGKLAEIGKAASAGGAVCSVAVDASGKVLVAAYCEGGSFGAYPIKEDGTIGAAASTIKFAGKGRASFANFSIDNRFLFVTDATGDKVMTYKVDTATAKVTANNPAFGALKSGNAPLRFSFHPSRRFAYSLNEATSTVTVFRYDTAAGKLTEAQSIGAKPEAFTAKSTASDLHVHPSGMFLYAANRGDDSLAVFRIDETNGMLTPLGHTKTGGKAAGNFRVSPEGKWLLATNQESNGIAIFRVDVNTGLLTATGDTLPLDQPLSIRFVPVTDVPAGGRGRGGQGPGGAAPPAGRGGRGQ